MKLSTRARYALRMMVAIARQSDDGLAVSLSDVARRTRLSRRYLEQLAIALRNASLVRGITGKGGGYVLTKPAMDITLGQIVQAAIGPINIVDCVVNPENCVESDYCECRWVYRTINDRIVRVLDELFLDDLVHQPRIESFNDDLAIDGSSCPTRKSPSVHASKEADK